MLWKAINVIASNQIGLLHFWLLANGRNENKHGNCMSAPPQHCLLRNPTEWPTTKQQNAMSNSILVKRLTPFSPRSRKPKNRKSVFWVAFRPFISIIIMSIHYYDCYSFLVISYFSVFPFISVRYSVWAVFAVCVSVGFTRPSENQVIILLDDEFQIKHLMPNSST